VNDRPREKGLNPEFMQKDWSLSRTGHLVDSPTPNFILIVLFVRRCGRSVAIQ
jgi:hypothetical protein